MPHYLIQKALRRFMEIGIINTQRVLSPTQITLADYVINPYRGCEFGCIYCYSLENKNIKKSEFFNSLGAKINAPDVLKKELKIKKPKRVLLGSTTECFQYADNQFKIVKQILEILNNHNIAYTILTKSHLIVKYLPLISKNKKNKIYFTFNLSSDRIIKMLERKSSSLALRLKAIEEIAKCNLDLRIHVGPFIPYLSDLTEIITMMPKGIKEVDIDIPNQLTSYEKINSNYNNDKLLVPYLS